MARILRSSLGASQPDGLQVPNTISVQNECKPTRNGLVRRRLCQLSVQQINHRTAKVGDIIDPNGVAVIGADVVFDANR